MPVHGNPHAREQHTAHVSATGGEKQLKKQAKKRRSEKMKKTGAGKNMKFL
jgi:hypothetical protein